MRGENVVGHDHRLHGLSPIIGLDISVTYARPCGHTIRLGQLAPSSPSTSGAALQSHCSHFGSIAGSH